MKLRFAEPGDIPEAVEIGRIFWDRSPYASQVDYNPEGVERLLGALVEKQSMLVYEFQGKLVGVAGLIVGPFHFDPSLFVATELFWYVDPEVRGLGIGKALLDGMERIAVERGAKIMTMGTMSTSDPEKAERLYAEHGYKQTEKSYTKVL